MVPTCRPRRMLAPPPQVQSGLAAGSAPLCLLCAVAAAPRLPPHHLHVPVPVCHAGCPTFRPWLGVCWCSPAPLTPLCYGLSPASFNLSHRGCLRSSPPRGVARKAGLHGWGWAHRDGAALLSPWHCLRSQGCSWCVLGMRGHGPCSCVGHAATQWQGASQGVPPPVPTALPVLLQSPRAVCRGVLGGADRLLPLEMWLWFTGELRSQPKGSESGVTAQLLPTEVCISASGAHGVGKPCPRPGSAVPAAIERRW